MNDTSRIQSRAAYDRSPSRQQQRYFFEVVCSFVDALMGGHREEGGDLVLRVL